MYFYKAFAASPVECFESKMMEMTLLGQFIPLAGLLPGLLKLIVNIGCGNVIGWEHYLGRFGNATRKIAPKEDKRTSRAYLVLVVGLIGIVKRIVNLVYYLERMIDVPGHISAGDFGVGAVSFGNQCF